MDAAVKVGRVALSDMLSVLCLRKSPSIQYQPIYRLRRVRQSSKRARRQAHSRADWGKEKRVSDNQIWGKSLRNANNGDDGDDRKEERSLRMQMIWTPCC